MDEENLYRLQRLEKIEGVRKKGGIPYPNTFKPTHVAREIFGAHDSKSALELDEQKIEVSLSGRVMARRSFGKAGFIKLRDRSGEIQVFCQQGTVEGFDAYKDIDLGDIVFVQGVLFRTKTNELTLKAKAFFLVTKSLQGLPEKWHGLRDIETRYRQRYVDLIANPDVAEIFRKRSLIIQGIRNFLIARDFLEVETPMMHPIPGGAVARPFVTHHNQLDRDLYLRIAPELYLKRLVVGGLERVFEINRSFRNEGVSTQHNPEFTMLEFYQSFATYEDLMKLTEEMFEDISSKTHGSNEVPYQQEVLRFKAPFQRFTLKEALVEIGGLEEKKLGDPNYLIKQIEKLHFKVPKGQVGSLQTTLFEQLVEKKLIQPTFVTQFPTEVSPLSRKNDADDSVVDRFELFIYGREIANAFSELNDPLDQKERFLKQVKLREAGDEEAMFFDADYIEALEYGMPPTAGEGIGIDRLVMLLTNSASIRDVILFPQMRNA